MFEFGGLVAFGAAYESLDPAVRPGHLKLPGTPNFENSVEWNENDAREARVRMIGAEERDDILAASQVRMFAGELTRLKDATSLFEIRVESWSTDEERVDLHVLVACETMQVFEEDGAIDLEAVIVDSHVHEALPKETASLLDEEPFQMDASTLPKEITDLMEQFFVAQDAGDWAQLAHVHPANEKTVEEQAHWLRCHYRELWDWSYARQLVNFWLEGTLGAVAIRGTLVAGAEGGVPKMAEDCLWTFSIRQKSTGQWIVRNWSQTFQL